MSTLKEPAVSCYCFDDVIVDCENFRIQKDDRMRTLTPRAFDVLIYLIENRGRVVEKQELFEQIWKESFVTDNALTRAVKEARRAIGDAADAPRYIETVPKRGYRFIAEVRSLEEVAAGVSREFIAEQSRPESAAIKKEAPFPANQSSAKTRIKLNGLMLTGIIVALAAIAIFAFAFWKPNTWPAANETTGSLKTTQITTWSGLDVFPALSPDGNAIAYSSDRSRSFEVYVKQLAPGGREIQITSDGNHNFQPAWSPDGKMLAYHSRSRGGIWIVPALGGVARRLTEFGSRPAWSPDGSLIAFQSHGLTDLGPTSHTVSPSTIWVVSPENGQAKQITQVGEPSGGHGSPFWSPDGKRIAFVIADIWFAEIWSAASDGGDLKRAVSSQGMVFEPVYSPDGKAIYYSGSSKTKSFHLWKVEVSEETGDPAGEPVEVSNTGPVIARHLTISADGKRLAYSALSMENNIRSSPVSPVSGEATGPDAPLTNDTSFRKSLPAFSPDGKKIAYVVRLKGSTSDIWVMDSDGSDARQLTTDTANESFPNWFPEGDRLAFASDRQGSKRLWSIRLQGGTEEIMLEGNSDVSYAQMSPDGKRVAFNSRRSGTINIWMADVEGGPPAQLTFDKELMGYPCWSPDGKLLAFEVKRGDDTHVVIMPSGGGTPVQLTFDRGQSWTGSWSPDGEKIAFAGFRNDVWNIWWVSRNGKVQKQVTNYSRPNIYVRYPAWSPLGDKIVYEYAETTGNIWMMDLK